ncbi:MAG: hypothetical protein LBM00_07455 [Deltaproteobacteria bacterium]|nr:hypothetical protein [Deltaproteobacteria bacterium]
MQYAIYISGVPKNDIVDYLDAMEKKEYYVSHKLLRIADDYAEIIYWAMETPEAIHLETDLFFADRTVTLTKRTILVRQQEE